MFNFLNLNAGWIHRIDNAHVKRPWKAPDWLLAAGVALAFVNAFLLGAGADVWGKGTLDLGHHRHRPDHSGLHLPALRSGQGRVSAEDAGRPSPDGKTLAPPKAGMLPYITLAAGIAVAAIGYVIFWT